MNKKKGEGDLKSESVLHKGYHLIEQVTEDDDEDEDANGDMIVPVTSGKTV